MKREKAKYILFHSLMILIVLFLVETASSLLLYFKYRNSIPELSGEGLRPATVTLINNAITKFTRNTLFFDKVSYIPNSFIVPDAAQGYKAAPGEYIVRFAKRASGTLEYLNTKITIIPDGTRFTGSLPEQPFRHVYVFGDSCVFGGGVNDEQTFTYLLQSVFRRSAFHLYAMGGYSWSNAYINIMKIKENITADDIIVIGYAAFYKERHIPSPSRLKYLQDWIDDTHPTQPLNPEIKVLHTQMNAAGDITFDTIPAYCRFHKTYCEQNNPSNDYVDRLSKALLTLIAKQTKAKIFLLHFSGPSSDPVLSQLPPNIELISALPKDFDYKIQDDILGFDDHPGPYWHHAMYAKLKERLGRELEAGDR